MGIQNSKPDMKRKGVFREYAEAAAIAIILALFIRTFVVQAFKIPSGSMQPTLLIGDHILVNKFTYGIKIPFIQKTLIPISQPQRGDVIVFIFPRDKSKDFIKRTIGLPGDRVQMVDRKIFINGELYDDTSGVYSDRTVRSVPPAGKVNFGPIIVPQGHLFVLGDNRDNSQDSRYWGFVPLESVKGKAFIIYWSWPRWWSAPRWDRFLQIIR